MSTKAQVRTQAKTPAAPAAARIPQPPVAEPEHEAERPDIAAQLEGAARLGHSLGAIGVDGSGPPIIQRQVLPEEDEEEMQLKREQAAVQRQEMPEEEEEVRMRFEEGRVGPQGGQVPPEVEAAIRRARGRGQPLEGALQEQMSASLGRDFSGVRVHTDAEADELNRQLQAKAFTTGQDIFFKRGSYHPESGMGKELLAHELTHVVQQGGGRVRGVGWGLVVGPAGDGYEQEANRAGAGEADRVTRTRGKAGGGAHWQAGGSPRVVQRYLDDEITPERLAERYENISYEEDEAWVTVESMPWGLWCTWAVGLARKSLEGEGGEGQEVSVGQLTQLNKTEVDEARGGYQLVDPGLLEGCPPNTVVHWTTRGGSSHKHSGVRAADGKRVAGFNQGNHVVGGKPGNGRYSVGAPQIPEGEELRVSSKSEWWTGAAWLGEPGT